MNKITHYHFNKACSPDKPLFTGFQITFLYISQKCDWAWYWSNFLPDNVIHSLIKCNYWIMRWGHLLKLLQYRCVEMCWTDNLLQQVWIYFLIDFMGSIHYILNYPTIWHWLHQLLKCDFNAIFIVHRSQLEMKHLFINIL